MALPKRLQCSRKNTDFFYDVLSYEGYINKMAEIIATTRVDLSLGEHVITANCPTEANADGKPRKIGMLLIHGLLDSPMMMQSLFQHFAAHDYLVRSLLLPGHGTVPGDLLEVTADSWRKAVDYGIRSFANQVEHLFIVSLSTGAVLSLLHATENPSIKGLILFAPAIRLKNPLAFTANWTKFMWSLIPRTAWLTLANDQDYAKYQSIALNGVDQLHHLIKQLRHSNTSSLPPIYMVLTDDDESISTRAAEKFFIKQKNETNRLLIYSNDRKTHRDSRAEIRGSAHPGQRIVNYSHICMTNSPEHPHYGIHGDFDDFLHYQQWWTKPFRKLPGDLIHSGALNFRNLKQYTLRRLTYNPDFYYMMERLDDFIEKTQAQ